MASVGWYQEQADVDRLSKVGAGSGFLRVLVQGVVSSSGAGDMLGEFRQYSPEISIVKLDTYKMSGTIRSSRSAQQYRSVIFVLLDQELLT